MAFVLATTTVPPFHRLPGQLFGQYSEHVHELKLQEDLTVMTGDKAIQMHVVEGNELKGNQGEEIC